MGHNRGRTGGSPATWGVTGRPSGTALAFVLLTITLLAVVLLVWTAGTATAATTEEPTEPQPAPTAAPLGSAPVLLIIDASGSMNADDGSGQPKIEAARTALRQLVDELGTDSQVGLRAYGHRTPNTDREAGCADTELLVPVSSDNIDQLRTAVDGLSASGFTPIGASLRAATEDLVDFEQRTVVLISDGIDTCAPPAACDVAREIVGEGVELRVEAIGFQVDDAAADELRCIAEVTGGTYRPADNAEDLARELRANVPTGEPIEGGPSPAEATLIGPGQYVDEISFPEERWYAVDLEPGDRVRASAAVIGNDETPSIPAAETEMILSFVDVIGSTPCDTDRVRGIGPQTVNLAVDGLQVAGGTVCSEPGRYTIGLRIIPPEDSSESRPLRDGLTLPIELFVAVTSSTVLDEPTEAPERPELAAPVPLPPGRQPTPPSLYLLTMSGFGLVGALLGGFFSRKLGP
ncbi:vWA domain-containing protein [Euzebya tangerina]|uniref:vWA domain-containing protein n=1 Tax=Euzebya tangerina TaxID=591198 RepID=UPI000E31D9F4|nr:VWA domain-containing protein [Euzebya tangerina]